MKRVLPWLVPAALAAALAPFVRGDGGDASTFVHAGRTLLSAHWRLAFADPNVQVGPLQLLLFGSVGRSPAALASLLAAAVTLLVAAATRAAGVRSPRVLLGAGGLALVSGLSLNAYEAGHPADTLLPLLWIVAAAAARRGRVLEAGALIGLSAGLETWGCLGVAVLGLAPRIRQALLGAAVAAGAVAALFAPFVAGGRFEMGSFHWAVAAGAPLTLVLEPGSSFGWSLRLLQAAVAVAAGAAVARAASRSQHALWLAPVAVVLARLLLDPRENLYYFAGVEAPTLVGVALFAARGLPFRGRVRESLA